MPSRIHSSGPEEAVRGHQRSSEVIRGHQRIHSSGLEEEGAIEGIRGNERPLEVIRGHQRSSEAIRGEYPTVPLEVIRGN
jgi:hypothetical protein